ncbi:hypothetical protein KM043_013270 [Ampulex compressa]|nr:hypothetical protein KM043_013270 [Ampulex compressa]
MEAGFLKSETKDGARLRHNSQYWQAIGSLLYIATVSRPDIAVAISDLRRNVKKPTDRNWKAVKRIMRYLATSIDKKLHMPSTRRLKFKCYWPGQVENKQQPHHQDKLNILRRYMQARN